MQRVTSRSQRLAALSFDEIVVVATKRATSIRDVAADVTVLRSADLRATMTTSLEDTFRYIPGVTHQSSGSRFGTEGITIRGIGGNRIALELDGVPLSDQFDIGNFSNATRDFADAGLLGQVEVMRGPASALYGGSALGGVVAMSTLDPRSLSLAMPAADRRVPFIAVAMQAATCRPASRCTATRPRC